MFGFGVRGGRWGAERREVDAYAVVGAATLRNIPPNPGVFVKGSGGGRVGGSVVTALLVGTIIMLALPPAAAPRIWPRYSICLQAREKIRCTFE